MEALDLEFSTDHTRAGFRLHRVEIYNWERSISVSGSCNPAATTAC